MSPANRLDVLVAEDRRDHAAALRTLLEADGHAVRVAPDGEVALAEVLAAVPDVLLLDLDLPKLDGLSVAAAVRQVDASKRPWVVAVTGHGERWVRDKAVQAGVDVYFVKPLDPNKLRAVLRLCHRPVTV